MKRKIQKILFGLMVIIIIAMTMQIKSIAVSTANTAVTTEQKAIQEVANAYYNRQTNAQYCSYRKSFIYSPEQATSQHSIYSVCSCFTYSVYYQAFGMKLQEDTAKIMQYALEYYDSDNIKTNDVIEFWHKDTSDSTTKYLDNKDNIKDIDLSTADGREKYCKELLTTYDLQIGDIICYRTKDNSAGHALMVYDIVYDSNGNPIDAVIRESTSKYETKSTKVTKGFSYADIENKITGIREGTFQELYLLNSYKRNDTSNRSSVLNNAKDSSYFTVLRPLLKDEKGNYTGQYYYSEMTTDSTSPFNNKSKGRTLTNYTISDSSLSRIKYSSIYIEKTVDVFNNSVIDLEDTLTYKIYIKNESNTTYDQLDVIENISEYVSIMNKGSGTLEENTIKWQIDGLNPGESTEISYKVKVKNNISVLGKKIISKGTVAGIPSATIINTISSNLNILEKSKISEKVQELLTDKTHTGKELIVQLYNDSVGFSLDFENMDLSKLIITRDGTQFYPDEDSRKPTLYLNTEDEYSNYIVNGYYGGLYTNTSGVVYQKHYENSSAKLSGRTNRETTIYKENLQTGDILVYKNTQIANSNVTYESEDGEFYLVYIQDSDKIIVNGTEYSGFIGIDANGNIKNIANDFLSLRTLLGKDFYAVFRPTMAYAVQRELSITKIEITEKPIKQNYIQNYEEIDLTGGVLTVTYNDESTDTISLTNENIKVTGFDNSKIGTNTITVEYQGFTDTFDIEIVAETINEPTQESTEEENVQLEINNQSNSNQNDNQIDNTVRPSVLPKTGIRINIFIISIIVIMSIYLLLHIFKYKKLDI